VVRLIFNKLLFCREWYVLKAIRVFQPIGIKTVSLDENSAHFVEAAYGCHAAFILHHAITQRAGGRALLFFPDRLEAPALLRACEASRAYQSCDTRLQQRVLPTAARQ
jgi:hypothetical protein